MLVSVTLSQISEHQQGSILVDSKEQTQDSNKVTSVIHLIINQCLQSWGEKCFSLNLLQERATLFKEVHNVTGHSKT